MTPPENSDDAPVCDFHGCEQPAVVWTSVAHDKGTPLCGPHAGEVKAYIARRVREIEDERTRP